MIARVILIIALIVGMQTFVPTGAGAQTTGTGTGPAGSPAPSGGACDWSAYKNSIWQTESGSAGYGALAPNSSAAGKYQFLAATWNSVAGSCPNAAMCPHRSQAFLTNPICWQVQECAMDALSASNYQLAQNSSACQSIIGKVVNSPRYGSCTVTWSGILAAYHLVGPVACNGPASGNPGKPDANGTTPADYMCRHGGLPIPNNCTPPPGLVGNGIGVVNATLPQIIAQGGQPGGQAGPINPLSEWWIAGLEFMAEQFMANMMAQVQAFGMMLDAKHQLETQRLLQQRMAQAHKDYQPSEQMCTFGTFAIDLASTQRQAEVTKITVANEILQREVGAGDSKGQTAMADVLSRFSHFRRTFCNPEDNGGGLRLVCPTAAPKAQQNLDINYTQVLDQPLSLQMDMTDGVSTMDEEAVFALVDNLFMHNVPDIRPSETQMAMDKFQYHYFNYRSILAMRGIARNSIANIIAMKTQTPFQPGHPGSGPYLKALMQEFGLSPQDINTMLGANPSYYAQMEILTKKIYQNPAFYTALYDKPTNVKRIRAAMRAIKLMQDRDIQLALQRREMLLSIMLELRLRERADAVYDATNAVIFKDQL